MAGSRVRVAANVTSTTNMAPMARDWKKEKGTMKRPQRAITTVKPLNSAVRPAVAPERSMAAFLSRPRASSSR